MKYKLVATSPTLEGIIKAINRYFYSTSYGVNEQLEITRADGYQLKGYRVIPHKRGGYRFEIGTLNNVDKRNTPHTGSDSDN